MTRASAGHFAAWGAIVAGALPLGLHVRAMTREEIVFVPGEGCIRFRALSDVPYRKFEWPTEVRACHADVRLFQREFGREMAAALRQGYRYVLGPVAEWLFLESEDQLPAEAPAAWVTQWDPPDDRPPLGADGDLPDGRLRALMEHGVAMRAAGEPAAALRAFERVFVAGLSRQDQRIMAIGLANEATVHADRERWERCLSLFIAAAACMDLASAREDGVDRWIRENLGAAWQRVPRDLAEKRRDAVLGAVCITDGLWRCDDLEITEALSSELGREDELEGS